MFVVHDDQSFSIEEVEIVRFSRPTEVGNAVPRPRGSYSCNAGSVQQIASALRFGLFFEFDCVLAEAS